MNIGAAADQSNLSVKTIRYYEDIALVTPARLENGYRAYSDQDIDRLRFLQRARTIGFTIEECRTLLSLYDDRSRASADVKAIAKVKLAEIDRKIEQLGALRASLAALVAECQGDSRPDCPIIDKLADAQDR